MDVWVQAVGFLKKHAPHSAQSLQGAQVEVVPGTSVVELLQQLDIPTGEVLRVAVNGQIVPPGHVLAPEDVVRVIPPIGGG